LGSGEFVREFVMSLFGPPFSKFKKFLWILTFAAALINAPGCFINGVPVDVARKCAFWTAFNLFACWLSWDSTWEKKKEEE
jgi:hypothetical protein